MAMVPPGAADTLACDATNSRRASSTKTHRNGSPFLYTVAVLREQDMLIATMLFLAKPFQLLPYLPDRNLHRLWYNLV